MPKLVHKAPKYSLHKPTGQAKVKYKGKTTYLGKHGSAESHKKYKKVIAAFGFESVKTGFIYFIQNTITQKIKIGFSSDPQKRLRALQTASPEPLCLVMQVKGTFKGERALHRSFAEHWVGGEWFEPGPEIMNAVRSNSVTGIFTS